MGMVNRERCQSHAMVWRRTTAPPKISQCPPELQHMGSPQPGKQLCPDLLVAHLQHHTKGRPLGVAHAGDKPWATTGPPSSGLGGCPWGKALPAAAGKQTGVLALPTAASDHQVLLSRARLGCGCEYVRSPGHPNSLPFPTRRASQASFLAPSWAAPCQGWDGHSPTALPAPGFLPPQLHGAGRTEQFCSCSPPGSLCSSPTSRCPQPAPEVHPPAPLLIASRIP